MNGLSSAFAIPPFNLLWLDVSIIDVLSPLDEVWVIEDCRTEHLVVGGKDRMETSKEECVEGGGLACCKEPLVIVCIFVECGCQCIYGLNSLINDMIGVKILRIGDVLICDSRR